VLRRRFDLKKLLLARGNFATMSTYSFELPNLYGLSVFNTDRYDDYYIVETSIHGIYLHSKKNQRTVHLYYDHLGNEWTNRKDRMQIFKDQDFNLYKCIYPRTIIFKDKWIVAADVYQVMDFSWEQAPKGVMKLGWKIFDRDLNEVKFIPYSKPKYALFLENHVILDETVYDNNWNVYDNLNGRLRLDQPKVDGLLQIRKEDGFYLYDVMTKKMERRHDGTLEGNRVTFSV